MKTLLRLEELAQFLFVVIWLHFFIGGVPWWVYLLLVLGPDIGMLGYLVNSRVGAFTYNILHHKGIAMLVGMCAFITGAIPEDEPSARVTSYVLLVTALVLYGHASMDRIFGYGLKFGDNFHHTHLGWIGKRIASDGPARSE